MDREDVLVGHGPPFDLVSLGNAVALSAQLLYLLPLPDEPLAKHLDEAEKHDIMWRVAPSE